MGCRGDAQFHSTAAHPYNTWPPLTLRKCCRAQYHYRSPRVTVLGANGRFPTRTGNSRSVMVGSRVHLLIESSQDLSSPHPGLWDQAQKPLL